MRLDIKLIHAWLALCLVFCSTAWADSLWLQQQKLKELEKMHVPLDVWITIAEASIQNFFSKCGSPCGETLFVKGRDIVISGFPEDTDPALKITLPLTDLLYQEMITKFPNVTHSEWAQFFNGNFRVGIGKMPKDAFVNLKLKEFGMNFETWEKSTLHLRKQLWDLHRRSGLSWNDILDASRKFGRDSAAMDRWTQAHGLHFSDGKKISEYGRLLTMADYFPPKFGNYPRLSNFVSTAIGSKELLVIDIKNLGSINRRAQDAWLTQGASLDQLETVREKGDKVIEEIVNSISRKLKSININEFQFYAEGDGLGFSIPSMSSDQSASLESWIAEQKSFYAALKPVKGETQKSILNAIAAGIKQVNTIKHSSIPSCLRDTLFMTRIKREN